MIKPTVKFSFENNQALLKSSDPRQVEYIRSLFYNKVTIYVKRRRREITVYQITPSGKFNICFFHEIYKKLKDTHILKLDDNFKKALKPQTLLDITKYATFENITYTPYQIDAIKQMMIKGRGVVELGTSGGKSYICAGFAKTVLEQQSDANILIIVPGLSLVNQLYNDFVDKFGMSDVTIFTSTKLDEFDQSKRIVITNSECIVNQVKNGKYLDVLDADYVIIDECHKINSNTLISSLLEKTETQKRFGLTATLPDVGVDYYNILGKIGPVIYRKNAKMLREDNYIAQLKIIMLVLDHTNAPNYPKTRDDGLLMYNFEKDWLIHNDKRNKFIGKIVDQFKNTSLILVDKIEYGEILVEMLNSLGKKCVFIRGSTKMEDRERIQQQMEVSDDMVVVAMDRIFSTGISINNIHNIIFAFIGKAKIKILQSIGRGLRKNHNKNHVKVFDVSDNLMCSISHFNERYAIYKQEVDEIKILKYKI
jgi:superfamily II DNA or RNA helicase